MIDIDEAYELLEEIAAELPEEFWDHLNGGVSLLPQKKKKSDVAGTTLYVLGEYHESSTMGRYIVLYYGSFRRVYGRDITKEFLKEEMRKTLFHEFTHHVEALAGERGLEVKDEQRLAGYQEKKQNENDQTDNEC